MDWGLVQNVIRLLSEMHERRRNGQDSLPERILSSMFGEDALRSCYANEWMFAFGRDDQPKRCSLTDRGREWVLDAVASQTSTREQRLIAAGGKLSSGTINLLQKLNASAFPAEGGGLPWNDVLPFGSDSIATVYEIGLIKMTLDRERGPVFSLTEEGIAWLNCFNALFPELAEPLGDDYIPF